MALAHSVGAGWRSGGTPPTHTRHIPAGGAYRVGTAASSWASRSRTDSGGPYRRSPPAAGAGAAPESCDTRTACAVWAFPVAGRDNHATCSNTSKARRQRRPGTPIKVPALHNRTEVRTPFLSYRSTPDSAGPVPALHRGRKRYLRDPPAATLSTTRPRTRPCGRDGVAGLGGRTEPGVPVRQSPNEIPVARAVMTTSLAGS